MLPKLIPFVFLVSFFTQIVLSAPVKRLLTKSPKQYVLGMNKNDIASWFKGECIQGDVDLVDTNGTLLAMVRKNVFSQTRVASLTHDFERITRSADAHFAGYRWPTFTHQLLRMMGFKTKVGAIETRFHPWDVIPDRDLQEHIIPTLEQVSDMFKQYAPLAYQQHDRILQQNRGLLRIGRSAFSVFSLNLGTVGMQSDAQTVFHKDTAHAKNGYEVLLILGDNMQGGELVLPEYDVALVIEPGDLLIMKGYDLVHGNLPLRQGKKLTVLLHILHGHDDVYDDALLQQVASITHRLR